jgi:nucleotidyltransferase substrate binding protein (TIGR01987 family)
MNNPSWKELEKALAALKIALNSEKTDLNRDATIQRFEFCVELSWKTAKKVMGSSSSAPKPVIREMAAQGLIADPDLWFEFLDARNDSSHTYKEEIAERVYSVAQKFFSHGESLLAKLKVN